MSQTNLISLERAKLNIPSATTGDERTIDALIGACSDAIQKYCRREFAVRSYDELYDGNGDRRLMLRQYPLISVESVRYRPVTVLKVINSDQATNQQARVTVTQTGLTLLRVASGVRVVDTSITWATYPTLHAVATAVVALGNGWSAQAIGGAAGDYGSWPSADLYIPPSYGNGTTSQGALTARGENAELKLHTYELAGYQWDVRGWLLRAIPYTDPELLHPEDLVWPVGVNNFRIQYTAGYPIIPEAVQEACASWVAERWNLTKRDPSLHSQASTVGGNPTSYVYEVDSSDDPPPRIVALLKPYRRITVANPGS
jgi:hypothetical protein